MASWGLVATIKAPEEKALAFAAHHLSLGADHLWLFFDDPESPIPAALANHPRITATLCDAAHWTHVGKKRPPAHQNRQTQNARLTYRALAHTDWIIHIDVDEFLLTPRPIAAIKFQVPQRSDITGRLIAGAALFGIGWGLGGFCPGPALTSAPSGLIDLTSVLVFIPTMLLGMIGFNKIDAALTASKS